jgi:hypothetical protein
VLTDCGVTLHQRQMAMFASRFMALASPGKWMIDGRRIQ